MRVLFWAALFLACALTVSVVSQVVGRSVSQPRPVVPPTSSSVSLAEPLLLPQRSLFVSPDPVPRPSPSRASRQRPQRAQGSPLSLSTRSFRASVTAYVCTGNRTASGSYPRVGDAASNMFPFGTRLSVPGHGVVTVRDRIGHSSDLDLYMGCGDAAYRRAVTFGRRTLTVSVLK